MVELMVGVYGVILWLVFKKFKLLPINTWTMVGAFFSWRLCAELSADHDGHVPAVDERFAVHGGNSARLFPKCAGV